MIQFSSYISASYSSAIVIFVSANKLYIDTVIYIFFFSSPVIRFSLPRVSLSYSTSLFSQRMCVCIWSFVQKLMPISYCSKCLFAFINFNLIINFKQFQLICYASVTNVYKTFSIFRSIHTEIFHKYEIISINRWHSKWNLVCIENCVCVFIGYAYFFFSSTICQYQISFSLFQPLLFVFNY